MGAVSASQERGPVFEPWLCVPWFCLTHPDSQIHRSARFAQKLRPDPSVYKAAFSLRFLSHLHSDWCVNGRRPLSSRAGKKGSAAGVACSQAFLVLDTVKQRCVPQMT